MKLSFTGTAAILLLAACSSPAPVVQQGGGYDSGTQARIRLYGQNQKPTLITSGIDCAAGERGQKSNIGGSMGDAFGSLVGSVKSHSIGIPATENSKALGSKNAILSRAFFREMAVPAGKAVNVETAFVGLTNTLQTPAYTVHTNEGSCTSRAASFVPEAGHDYEVVGVSGKACGVAVYDIAADGSLKAVPLANAVKCSRR